MGKTCEICGANSGMYPLCTKCFKLRDEGKIVKCEKCGAWHLTDKPCKCEETEKKEERKEEPQFTCILCGKEASPGHHFCYECYRQYKDQSIIIRIDKCSETEIMEKYADGYIITTDDGHKVRSKDEAFIDNYFFNRGIKHTYEKKIKLNKNCQQTRNRRKHPNPLNDMYEKPIAKSH